ncbi:MAG: ribonuclease R [Paracoccaceae bacterium]|jgi:ribonuclease R
MKHFPSKETILEWIKDNPRTTSKRDVAKAFGITGDARIELKRILKELRAEGHITKARNTIREADTLQNVELLQVTAIDADGDLFGEPANWKGEEHAPSVLIVPMEGNPALGIGDKALCRITKTGEEHAPYEGRLIRKIGSSAATVLGIFKQAEYGGRVIPVDKKSSKEWQIAPEDRNGAREGELVEATQIGKVRMGLPKAKITARLGDATAPKSVSLIAIHEHGIPVTFPDNVEEETLKAEPVKLGKREDLRHLPLFTIDPSDARDHDDAICALPDTDPKNDGGHIVWVAIADVAYYVRSNSALDREAKNRGNSSYFPDRVVPMLPDSLSGDLCSLHEGVDRPCIALEIQLNAAGRKIGHRFTRALMRSPASLSYEQAQAAADGNPDAEAAPLLDHGIKPLWAAYFAARKETKKRQPLHLDLPERKIILADDGEVVSVAFRDRFDAHKLVEEFMVLANVCAAETLEAKRMHLLYRIHEEPNPEKLESLRETVESVGLTLAKGQVLKTAQLNKLLDAAAGTEHSEVISMSVLRSMTQAYYSMHNLGHFGLSLMRYAHFTSPIRRYADLTVHRALIKAHGWGDDGQTPEEEASLEEIAEHISKTERRSMLAERDTTDRYLAAYLSERIGNEFEGKVSGIARFGLFVKLNETGADGIIPISHLGREYFHHDADAQTLTGERSRLVIRLGMKATVRLAEAVPVTGGLMFELLELEGKAFKSAPGGRKHGGGGNRKHKRAKIRRSKDAKRKKRKT